MQNNTILCRCEDLTQKEIRDLIDKGFTSIDEIKRVSRCGMGPCQGRGCRQQVAQEIATATNQNLDEIKIPKFRPPVKPIKLGVLLEEGEENA